MYLSEKDDKRLEVLIGQLSLGDKDTVDYVEDLLMWGLYGPEVLSQFGLGLCGFVFRHNRTNVRLAVKAVENGVPLVAFVTASTARGCIEQMFDLLGGSKLKWQKDKYPWI